MTFHADKVSGNVVLTVANVAIGYEGGGSVPAD